MNGLDTQVANGRSGFAAHCLAVWRDVVTLVEEPDRYRLRSAPNLLALSEWLAGDCLERHAPCLIFSRARSCA